MCNKCKHQWFNKYKGIKPKQCPNKGCNTRYWDSNKENVYRPRVNVQMEKIRKHPKYLELLASMEDVHKNGVSVAVPKEFRRLFANITGYTDYGTARKYIDLLRKEKENGCS